ncbi:MAG: hypothetical protein HY046_13005 [Acidobacteria bacterium]|nr:hypothetical protein [Acidobacteriota bacterium]
MTRYFQILLTTDDDLRRRPDPRLHLEMGLLRMVNAARLAPLEEILSEMRGDTARTGTAGNTATMKAEAKSVAKAEIGFGASAKAATPSAFQAATPEERAPISLPPRMDAAIPTPAAPPSAVKMTAQDVSGIDAVQVDAIKAAIAEQHKFLWSLIEPVTRWEVEGGEMRLYFSPKDRTMADLLQGRAQMEQLRAITSRVVGQPLRVCVKLDSVARGSGVQRSTAEIRAQFEQDPIVKEMLRRFGGRISEVKRRVED